MARNSHPFGAQEPRRVFLHEDPFRWMALNGFVECTIRPRIWEQRNKNTKTGPNANSTPVFHFLYFLAQWWRKLLEEAKPQTKAGMSSFAQNFITDQHNRMKAQITPEQAEAFEKNLAALLGAKEGWGVTLHVDYDPHEPLAAIMRDNRIPLRIFPPHTRMHVERGRIEVAMDGKEPTELPLSAD